MKRIQSLTFMFLLLLATFGKCYSSKDTTIRRTKSSGNLLEKQNSNENYNSLENWSSKTVIVPRKHKKVDLYKADPHYEAIMNDNQDLKRQLKKTNSSKDILVSSVNDLVKKIKSNEKTIAESHLENAKKNEVITQLTNKEREKKDKLIIANLNQKLENNQKDLNNIQDELYDKEKTNTELSRKILILNNQIDKTKIENQNNKSTIEALHSDNKKLSSEVTSLKENVSTLKSTLQKRTIEGKIEKIVFEENQNQWIKEQNRYDEIINSLNKIINSLFKDIASLKEKLEKKSFESVVIEESDIDNIRESTEQLPFNNIFAQVEQENKTLQEKIGELQHDLKQARLCLDNSHAANIEQTIEIAELRQTVNNFKLKPNQATEIITALYTPWTYKAATGFFALTTVVTAYIAYLFYKQKKVSDAKQTAAQ